MRNPQIMEGSILRSAIHFLAIALMCGPTVLRAESSWPFTPPPKPAIPPLIAQRYPNDADGDRIDDQLFGKARRALAAETSAATPNDKSEALGRLAEMVEVELIFSEQVTQKQIDDFRALGGEITYLYRAVSYGWNGRLPLSKIQDLPAAMGETLVLVEPPGIWRGTMDEATLTGRLRPIWAPGFARSSIGFSGSTNITIAFADTGLDETHWTWLDAACTGQILRTNLRSLQPIFMGMGHSSPGSRLVRVLLAVFRAPSSLPNTVTTPTLAPTLTPTYSQCILPPIPRATRSRRSGSVARAPL
jgi:hypothetical protein